MSSREWAFEVGVKMVEILKNNSSAWGQYIASTCGPMDKKNESVGWESMPDVALCIIYHHLGYRDRLNMSFVCKRWNKIFHFPELWRQWHIDFGFMQQVSKGTTEGRHILNIAKAKGMHLQRLLVSCYRAADDCCKRRARLSLQNLWPILNLHKTQLLVLRMRGAYVILHGQRVKARARFLETFSQFLQSQKCIRRFDMSGIMLKEAEGFRLLNCLAQGSGIDLKHLNIEDFFSIGESLVRNSRFSAIVPLFKSLSTLELNYTYITDEVMRTLASNSDHRLLHLNILIYFFETASHRIDPQSWICLRKSNSYLQVRMEFRSIWKVEDVKNIATRLVPLRKLKITIDNPDEGVMSAAGIAHLTRYIAHDLGNGIDELYLSSEMDNDEGVMGRLPHQEVDRSMVYLLNRCPCLQRMNISLSLEQQTKEQISSFLKERQLSTSGS